MDFGDKKTKQKPYSEYERQILLQLVQQQIEHIENRRTDGTTQKKKNDAWEDIRSQFNNSHDVSHKASVAQLKKLWQNLKTRARDAKTKVAQKNWTGGGPALPDIGSEETQVLSIIPTVMPSINVEIDSDIRQPRTFKSCPDDDDDSPYWQRKSGRFIDVAVHVVGEEGDKPESVENTSTPPQDIQLTNSPKKISTSTLNRKNRNLEASRDSLENLKKDLVRIEIFKIKQQIKQDEEKYRMEMEILGMKRALLKKELNK